jgi:hypothetical protein
MTRLSLSFSISIGLAVFSTASGQNWAQFDNETAQRLIADPSVGEADSSEKDYAWGDVDQDGDVDLVCVRKGPWDSTLGRPNVLFMNEGPAQGHAITGVLVDRTAEFASASDVAGDQGFLTATNDRDVKLADFNGDGWLDIVTAVTLSDGRPKHISHPRIYINLGAAESGQWLGFQHEDGRIPQLAGNAPNGFPHAPRFNAVAVGDVTGDGLPDLFFTDTDLGGPETFDFNNRLLINDGGGFFSDESSRRMTPQMLLSSGGIACAMADINLDGALDVVKQSAVGPPLHIAVIYNDPSSKGFFNAYDIIYSLSATDLSLGDLNNDGRLDVVITDDGTDRYLLNTSNGGDGLANFSAHPFSGDDGFGGESVIADLDLDGWNDVLISDVDFAIPGCQRRAHIYHNLGNAPNVTLTEQGQVIPNAMLTGTHDIAVFDLSGDGRPDIVVGRCSSMQIWIGASCPADLSGDGNVGPLDLAMLLSAWGPNPGHPADLNDDQAVGPADLASLLSAWGKCD